MFSLVGSRERGTLHTLCLLLPQVMNGTGPRRQFIPKAARLSSRAAFGCWGTPRGEMNSRRSFDHLVGAGEQRRWHGEAERLGSLKIDHQLVFGRRLHRKVGRLLALEDAINVGGRAPEVIDLISAVGDQTAA